MAHYRPGAQSCDGRVLSAILDVEPNVGTRTYENQRLRPDKLHRDERRDHRRHRGRYRAYTVTTQIARYRMKAESGSGAAAGL